MWGGTREVVGDVGDKGPGRFVALPRTSQRFLSEEQKKDSNQNPSCRRVITKVSWMKHISRIHSKVQVRVGVGRE